MTESEYLVRDAKGLVVGRFMVECRTKAPDVYKKAFALHYYAILMGDPRGKNACAAELEAAVKANPAHALIVIEALECATADGARYEKLISTLRAMRARCLARRLMDEMGGADGSA